MSVSYLSLCNRCEWKLNVSFVCVCEKGKRRENFCWKIVEQDNASIQNDALEMGQKGHGKDFVVIRKLEEHLSLKASSSVLCVDCIIMCFYRFLQVLC